jgi:hypothetical protein
VAQRRIQRLDQLAIDVLGARDDRRDHPEIDHPGRKHRR